MDETGFSVLDHQCTQWIFATDDVGNVSKELLWGKANIVKHIEKERALKNRSM